MDARPDDDAEHGDLPDATQPRGPEDGPAEQARPEDGPAPGASSDDEVWASIVARLTDVDAPVPGGTDAGGRTGRTLRPARRPAEDDPQDEAAPAAPPPLTGRDWDGTSQYDAAEEAVDDMEHFVPGDPGPVLGGDPLLTLAWSAAVGAPLLLLVVAVAWRDAPTTLVRAAVVAFLAAVAVLVWRMPQRRDPSDDDGAVV